MVLTCRSLISRSICHVKAPWCAPLILWVENALKESAELFGLIKCFSLPVYEPAWQTEPHWASPATAFLLPPNNRMTQLVIYSSLYWVGFVLNRY
jgi:hypothetical protein